MQRSTFRLSWRLRTLVYVSFGALLFSGAVWMYAQRRLEDEGWEKIPRQLMQIHGAAAMLSLLALGALTAHVKRGWRADKNRLSGIVLLAANAFLVASGYGLYYAGNEDLRAWLSRWHGWIGLGVFVALPAHVIVGRLIMQRLHARKLADHPVPEKRPGRPSLP